MKRDIRNENRDYLRGADAVFHLAAISGYPACEANAHSARLINVDATENLVACLEPEQLLIFASTTSFYGAKGGVGTEDAEIKPVSLYGVTKAEGERIVMARENSISLRWATVFGISPRMREGLLVNDFAEKAVHERTIVLFDSWSRRTFMHVSDLVRGYVFALQNVDRMRGGIFNMGSSRLNYTKADIAKKVQEQTECEIIESHLGDTDIRHFEVSFDKAAELGFDCEVSLEEGIAELIKLYRFYDPNSFIRPI